MGARLGPVRRREDGPHELHLFIIYHVPTYRAKRPLQLSCTLHISQRSHASHLSLFLMLSTLSFVWVFKAAERERERERVLVETNSVSTAHCLRGRHCVFCVGGFGRDQQLLSVPWNRRRKVGMSAPCERRGRRCKNKRFLQPPHVVGCQ